MYVTDKVKNCDIVDNNKKNKEDRSPSLRSVHCPKAEIYVEMFRTKLQRLVFSPPTWWPVNSVNIWNLHVLWLSSQLTI